MHLCPLQKLASDGVMTCRLEEVKRQISSLEKMITMPSLPDGGAKLHGRLASLRKELATLDDTGALHSAIFDTAASHALFHNIQHRSLICISAKWLYSSQGTDMPAVLCTICWVDHGHG